MSDLVCLEPRRHRGWPWPEKRDYGSSPMYGEDGWCRGCGVPLREQIGNLTLQRKGFKSVEGAWIPNWRFDALCLGAQLAAQVADEFRVELREVSWHPSSPGDACQVIVPPVGSAWFDHDQLRDRLIERHGTAGSTCAECGVWRWMPLHFAPIPPLTDLTLPPLLDVPEFADVDVAASPEWFGSGLSAFRLILVTRAFADTIIAADPREFNIVVPARA